MKLDGAVIRALTDAAERCGGAAGLGARAGVDPSCISRYLRGKVKSVSDENWQKLRKFLKIIGSETGEETAFPVIEWRSLQDDPSLLWRNGGTDQLVLRAQGLQMAPRICDRDLMVVSRKKDLKAVPENKIIVAVYALSEERLQTVCKRLRKLNGSYWLFSDEPQGSFFQAEIRNILWVGVVLRKICEL